MNQHQQGGSSIHTTVGPSTTELVGGDVFGSSISDTRKAIDEGRVRFQTSTHVTTSVTRPEVSEINTPAPTFPGIPEGLTVDADLPGGRYGRVGTLNSDGTLTLTEGGVDVGTYQIPDEVARTASLLVGDQVPVTVNGGSPLDFATVRTIGGAEGVNSGVKVLVRQSGETYYSYLEATIDPTRVDGLRVVSTDVTDLSAFKDLITAAGGSLNSDGQLIIDGVAEGSDIPRIKQALAELGIVVGIVPNSGFDGHHKISLFRIAETEGGSECIITYVTEQNTVEVVTYNRPTYTIDSTTDLPEAVTVGPHPLWMEVGDGLRMEISTGLIYAWTDQDGNQVSEPNVVGQVVVAHGLTENVNVIGQVDYASGNLGQLRGQVAGQALVAVRLANLTNDDGVPLFTFSASGGVRGALNASALDGTRTTTLNVYGINGELIHTRQEEENVEGGSFNSLDVTAALTAQLQVPNSGFSAWVQGVYSHNITNSLGRDPGQAVMVHGGINWQATRKIAIGVTGGHGRQLGEDNSQTFVGANVRVRNSQAAPVIGGHAVALADMIRGGFSLNETVYSLGISETNPRDQTVAPVEGSQDVALNTAISSELVPLGRVGLSQIQAIQGDKVKVLTALPSLDGQGTHSVVAHTLSYEPQDVYNAAREQMDLIVVEEMERLNTTLQNSSRTSQGLSDSIIERAYENAMGRISSRLLELPGGDKVTYAKDITGAETTPTTRLAEQMAEAIQAERQSVIDNEYHSFVASLYSSFAEPSTDNARSTLGATDGQTGEAKYGNIKLMQVTQTNKGALIAVVENNSDGLTPQGGIEDSVYFLEIPQSDLPSVRTGSVSNRGWLAAAKSKYLTDESMDPTMLARVVASGATILGKEAAGAPVENGLVVLEDGTTVPVGSIFSNEGSDEARLVSPPASLLQMERFAITNWQDSGLPSTPQTSVYPNGFGGNAATYTFDK